MDTYFGKRCKQDPHGCTTRDAMMLLVIGRVRREWLGVDEELEPESSSVEELIPNEVVPIPSISLLLDWNLKQETPQAYLGHISQLFRHFGW